MIKHYKKIILCTLFVFIGGYLFYTQRVDVTPYAPMANINEEIRNNNYTKASSRRTPKADEILFQHPRYGFSLIVPDNLQIERASEGQATETVVFAPNTEATTTPRFQIFITPYFQKTISGERIQKDTAGAAVNNPKEIILGLDSIPALLFTSSHPLLGKTREVWFLHRGYLFEVTTGLNHDEWLAEILETLSFATLD